MHLAYKKFMKLKSSSNNGDTIIEVLLSIAIVGVVIMGAYSLAGNSLQQGISASEHTQAVKIAEAQLEALKYRQKISDYDDWTQFTNKDRFCLNVSATDPASTAAWNPIINNGTNPENLAINSSNYAAACVQDNNKYFVDISIPPGAPTSSTYLITVRWQPPGGGALSQTQLYYKFPPKIDVIPGEGPAPTSGPTVNITCTPSSILVGNSCTLTWSSDGADSCTASGAWSGSKPLDGSVIVTPPAFGNYTYTLTCTNSLLELSTSDSTLERVCRLQTTTTTYTYYTTDPVYGYYISGWTFTGWSMGARRGDLDGYRVTATYGTGNNVYAYGGSGTGYIWLIWYNYSGLYPGWSWYNVWEAVPNYAPVYSYGIIGWVNTPHTGTTTTTTTVCP